MSFVKQQEAGKKLRVIGAGLMGTGTASLKLALEDLLMAPCYHSGHAAVESSTRMWLDIFDNNGDGIEEILSGYVATVDYPACCFFEKLMIAHPDAKVSSIFDRQLLTISNSTISLFPL